MQFKARLIAAIVAAGVPLQAGAGGGGMSGGATEVTQLINKAQLVDISAKGAAQIANQVKDYAMQVQQYATMVQNLTHLPSVVAGQIIGPYKDVLADAGTIIRAANDVYQVSTRTSDMLNQRIQEMQNLKMDPATYLQNEMMLATARGGQYQAKLDRDRRFMEESERRARALQDAINENPNITGNVQGLQQVATLHGMMAAELNEMNRQIREQNMLMASEKGFEYKAAEAAQEERKARAKAEAEMRERDEAWAKGVRFDPSYRPKIKVD